ncbi:MAG TPA: hypothetical protein VFN67_15955 [Polyangiales bacterium]|nr:hypothetical protein [Polyangiales bacterium]
MMSVQWRGSGVGPASWSAGWVGAGLWLPAVAGSATGPIELGASAAGFIGKPVPGAGLEATDPALVPPLLAAGIAAMGGVVSGAAIVPSGTCPDGGAGSFEHALAAIKHNANCAAACILSRNIGLSRLIN